MSSGKQQIVKIDPPEEIRFKANLVGPVTSYMNLTNPSEHRVLFKIKTTAPRKYCVKPTCGQLLPGTTVPISITLQPFYHDLTDINKHKFMVQTTIAETSDSDPETIWDSIDPKCLVDSKLKCVYEGPTLSPPKPVARSNPLSVDEVTRLREENAQLKNRLNRPEENVVTSSELKHTFYPTPENERKPNIIKITIISVLLAVFGIIYYNISNS